MTARAKIEARPRLEKAGHRNVGLWDAPVVRPPDALRSGRADPADQRFSTSRGLAWCWSERFREALSAAVDPLATFALLNSAPQGGQIPAELYRNVG